MVLCMPVSTTSHIANAIRRQHHSVRPRIPASGPAGTPSGSISKWRICFRWTTAAPEDIEIVDYH
jgi:hypothetical protein